MIFGRGIYGVYFRGMCGFRRIRAGGTAERGIHTILTSGQRNRCLEGKEATQTDFHNLFVKTKRRRETKHNYVFASLLIIYRLTHIIC